MVLSMRRWNAADAEFKPNGMTLNCIKPRFGTVKAVSGLLSSVSGFCQYPFFKSMVDRYLAPLNLSSVAFICGSGYASFSVT